MSFNPPAVPVEQIPLIQIVASDDLMLFNSPEGVWFRILNGLPWKEHRVIAAKYYDALSDFNHRASVKRQAGNDEQDLSGESKEDARMRLLFQRATMNEETPVLFEPEFRPVIVDNPTNPLSVAPGLVPSSSGGGRKPKCFFGLFKAFIGTSLIGLPAEPDKVHLLLCTNPSFARVCGFEPDWGDDACGHDAVPSFRKLQQFDQIMTEYGLWNEIKRNEVVRNLESDLIKQENVMVGDTTHYLALSEFEIVTYTNEKGKVVTKSQSKTTKKCNCQDKEKCGHTWELADEGAGTIVKSGKKMIWGHKASIVGFPAQGIPLDAAAISDSASHDSKTILPHVLRVFGMYPEIKPDVNAILYDSACYDQKLKDQFQKLGIELKASVNPRCIKSLIEELPRGVEKITPYGTVVCQGGHDMDYKGVRNETRTFIYGPPVNEDGITQCLKCEHKGECCPNSAKGRTVTVSFDSLSHLDPQDPPMAKRFVDIMKQRTSVERMIKRLKCDLGDSRLEKRGNASFQAYLDKTMIAFHILLRQ